MEKTFSILLIICGLIFFSACKNDPPPPTADEQHMINIAGPDYEDDIRLPVDPYGNVDTNSMAKIAFEQMTFDFGTIRAGEQVNYTFNYTNTGVKDLKIIDTKSSCGCTVSEHSQDPIKPGAKGNITVSYDSKDRKGKQDKIITVISNTYPNEHLLKIKGFVISPSDK